MAAGGRVREYMKHCQVIELFLLFDVISSMYVPGCGTPLTLKVHGLGHLYIDLHAFGRAESMQYIY